MFLSFLFCLSPCELDVYMGLALCFVPESTVVYNGFVSEELTHHVTQG